MESTHLNHDLPSTLSPLTTTLISHSHIQYSKLQAKAEVEATCDTDTSGNLSQSSPSLTKAESQASKLKAPDESRSRVETSTPSAYMPTISDEDELQTPKANVRVGMPSIKRQRESENESILCDPESVFGKLSLSEAPAVPDRQEANPRGRDRKQRKRVKRSRSASPAASTDSDTDNDIQENFRAKASEEFKQWWEERVRQDACVRRDEERRNSKALDAVREQNDQFRTLAEKERYKGSRRTARNRQLSES
ncbi:hypothetical protein P280DRAFT_471832 [Massarina eburnea CBS 473.64]|uniref:Uncharacterized protein n=1 Tax=Massarina eburnea CBS 473.64 TaxID=1395130 RepID=A0A6A6RV91_9PLEO|nr:hypothetical protein P280DRAFT_471832 [Massarina eburnea CBS 473.64]